VEMEGGGGGFFSVMHAGGRRTAGVRLDAAVLFRYEVEPCFSFCPSEFKVTPLYGDSIEPARMNRRK